MANLRLTRLCRLLVRTRRCLSLEVRSTYPTHSPDSNSVSIMCGTVLRSLCLNLRSAAVGATSLARRQYYRTAYSSGGLACAPFLACVATPRSIATDSHSLRRTNGWVRTDKSSLSPRCPTRSCLRHVRESGSASEQQSHSGHYSPGGARVRAIAIIAISNES